MDEKMKLVFGAAAIIGASMIASAYLAAPPRYAMVTVDGGLAFRLDRSSGAVLACGISECRPVSMETQSFGDAANAAAAANTLHYTPIPRAENSN